MKTNKYDGSFLYKYYLLLLLSILIYQYYLLIN